MERSCDEEVEKLKQTLERKTCFSGLQLLLYDGFWCNEHRLLSTIRFQKNFVAHDADIILCTKPKCGTTWLKALTFSIAKRNLYPINQTPILTNNPHILIPCLDMDIYATTETPDIENIPSPRLFSTHLPYHSLPSSIRTESKCKIIYICRNPLDQFTSLRQFLLKVFHEKEEEFASLDEAFEMYCEGIYLYGPFWDHVSGFWKAHAETPHKILFLKYEDLKEDTISHVRKIADFIGMPFSEEEEKQGLVEQIVNLCSLESLRNLEVNKASKKKYVGLVQNSLFFRKGEVGDWSNCLTPSMARRYQDILESKLEGSGLKFKF